MMKQQFITKILLIFFVSLVGTKALAYDIEVANANGVTIYYNYINDGTELEVARGILYNSYNGSVVIPEEVTYMNRTRKVTSIGYEAFACSESLTSITIPNSVLTIHNNAFHLCTSLTSVTIPNSVTNIGEAAFLYCSSLTSINIPNSVTSIENWAFAYCSNLTSVTIPNSVTSIGIGAFQDCQSLNSVNIGNSVTIIGNQAFGSCSSLTSVIIPNSVTNIGDWAFSGCNFTSVTIPNSVKSIGKRAFFDCSNLKSVIIGNSVTNIGGWAFYCENLSTIVSLIENPFKISGKTSEDKTFTLDVFNNITLYIPLGTIEKYRATEGWKDFIYMEEGTGPNGGDTPTTKKCEKPTISYTNGKLTFNSTTEGVTFQSNITDVDINSYSSNEVQLGVTYNISVYATKSGYEDSETVTATLCWIDVDPKTEGISNSMAYVRASPVLIQSNGNVLSISGAPDGSEISVFNLSGLKVGTAKAVSETTDIITSLQNGDVGIVKIGSKSVKVVIR